MNKRGYVSSGKIRCHSCGNYYYDLWMYSHQRDMRKKTACASMIRHVQTKGYEIYSYYGSEYDGISFKIMGNYFYKKHSAIKRLIEIYESGIETCICDNCVKRFNKRKEIVVDSNQFG